ncbi:response regulator [Steroidobacter sp. S1-65]|uniref:histidine kinase n=1 Tax=Steroidobacter gossypii TaxID=2805490 RepID=A0ABS1WVL3_9GAMM|nr:response regulator [Steroidobacter gossypii]
MLLRFVSKATSVNNFVALNQRIAQLSNEVALRRQAQRAALEQGELLRVTLASIGDAVITTDIRGNITFMNPIAEAHTQCPLGLALGRPIEEVFVIRDEEHGKPVDNPVRRVLREGRIVALANHTVLVSRLGEILPIEDTAAPIKVSNGELLGVVLVFHEVAARRRLERDLIRQAEALREADRRKDEFLATLAHELRNPLAALSAASHLLAKSSQKPHLAELARDALQRQVAHMAHLLDALLDVARITHGRVHLTKEYIPLQTCIDAALETIKPLLATRPHELSVELPQVSPRVHADRVRVTQILVNLLTNAIKYTDAVGRVRLRVETVGSEVVISVQDTGIGIPPEDLDRVFEMFSQTRPAMHRSDGGLGIGLSLVRSLVQMHGGSVRAHSAGIGQGSEFVVRLPLALDQAATAGPDHRNSAEPKRTSARRILIADDNEDGAITWAALLELVGHSVRVAHNGRKALEIAETFAPEVAMIDIGMPEMNGIEVARALRSNASGRRMVLIAVSGWGQPQDKQLALDAGFDFHLTKPVELEAIEALLASMPQPGSFDG